MGQQIARLEASDGQSGNQFGKNVAIDGDTVAVGAYNHDSETCDVHLRWIWQ